ncbi:MAG: serine hydrolase domain-containing protein [Gemmatimonadota bacterium]|jgi:CubicO group peptidase (beta-lactamase class C family)
MLAHGLRFATLGRCLFLLFALPGPPVLGQAPPEFAGRFSQLSRELRDTLDAAGMVGASWAFVTGDEILDHEVFGFADLDTGREVDEATIYHWGSITKTLTGISIMQLRDRGLLSLDDPIVPYVPELREVHNPYGPMEEITLRQLLSHSAGFRGPTWPWGGGEDWHPHEPTRWEQLVAMMPYTEILFPPGSRFSYSNPGIVFLGQVIQRLSGEEWEVYVEKNILRPLGMHRSYFDYTPYHLLRYRSNNYTVVDGVPVANGLDFDTGITVSNGGLNAPVTDMARYLAFLTDSGDQAARERYAGILARTSLEEMWEEEVPIGETGSLREAMGLCFFLETYGGHRYVGHTGSQKAFQAFIYVDPATGTGAIAAFNSTGAGPAATARPATREILNRLRERMFDEIFPLFR